MQGVWVCGSGAHTLTHTHTRCVPSPPVLCCSYCPVGAGSATTVTAGFYATGGSSATTRTGELECPEGMYCVGGVQQPCPAGRYGTVTGQSTEGTGCPDPCPAGSYCPEGTSVPVACGAANVFCPEGSVEPLDVGIGNYSTPEASPTSARTGHAPCPAGYVCPPGLGTRQPCGSAGSYCPPTSALTNPVVCPLG